MTASTRCCIVCGKPRIRRPDGVCSECAPCYYGTAAVCQHCGDPTRAADRCCPDCRATLGDSPIGRETIRRAAPQRTRRLRRRQLPPATRLVEVRGGIEFREYV